MLKSTVLVAYSVHSIVFNVSGGRMQRLIDKRHTLVGFLPVCCTQELSEEEKGAEDKEKRYSDLHY